MNEIHSQILIEQFGTEEKTKLRLLVKRSNGKAWLEISKTVSQIFETKDFSKAEDLFEKITGGGGRRVFKPEDLQ